MGIGTFKASKICPLTHANTCDKKPHWMFVCGKRWCTGQGQYFKHIHVPLLFLIPVNSRPIHVTEDGTINVRDGSRSCENTGGAMIIP